MNWPRLIWNFYGVYIHAFRLYIIMLLVLALFFLTNPANSIHFTANGYHLAIFELEFYSLLLLLYNFRPSRFRSPILKAYEEKSPPPYHKERFFWMIYLVTLLIIFGVPLLLCYGYIKWIFDEIVRSNEFIITNAGAWVPAILFLILSCFKLWVNLSRSLEDAKLLVGKTLYVLILTGAIAVILYLSLLICRHEADLMVILCLAFNVALIWTDWKIYLKTRATVQSYHQ